MFSITGRRKDLPSLPTAYHCSVIGTCFHHAELLKLGRKTGLRLDASATEHQVHVAFVNLAAEKQEGKILSKALDAKFPLSIKRLRELSGDEELRAIWTEARENGGLPGVYWALMSHPRASDDLLSEIHGELHMLAHELVQQQQRDLRRLQQAQRENLQLQENLARMRQRQQQAAAAQREETVALVKRLAQAEDLARRFRQVSAELAELKAGAELIRLREQIGSMEQQLAVALRERENKQKDLDLLRRELKRFFRQEDRRRQEGLGGQDQGGRTPGREEPASPNCLLCQDQLTAECPGPNLCGRRILYVGGINRLVPHYRELVEKSGGSFFHHDGGQEESTRRLPQLLGQVDAVFCPVNCISHDACLCVKKICKRMELPFVLMRSSSLSSLAEGLRRLAD